MYVYVLYIKNIEKREKERKKEARRTYISWFYIY